MLAPLKSLNELETICQSFPFSGPVKEWKDRGKKVMGWVCNYVPEEVIYAAGMLPLRVTGDPDASIVKADAYLYPLICSFPRSCLELAIYGEYNFLDGLITGNTCDHIRRLYDVWQHYFPPPFIHLMDIPRNIETDNALSFFKEEIMVLKGKLEELSGEEISTKYINQAIKVHNEMRTLLRRLYDLRRSEIPPISGTESLIAVKAGMFMPKDLYINYLKRLLEEISTQNSRAVTGKVRLLVTGSIMDNPEFIRVIEEAGGLIVTDELCTGARYFWELVETEGDPWHNLARRYLKGPLCARMGYSKPRFDYLMEMTRYFKIEGVIYQTIKFCDIYAHDQPRIEQRLKEEGIPTLDLDMEYGGVKALGQIRTRVQAFIEMLGG